jgi:8-oxo-dGTP pyrophosphatase MutT (NUDIX family)
MTEHMIDGCYRLAYRCAYQMMRVYWRVFKPVNHGALVAIWYDDRILLIKNSYVGYYSLPGGYIKSGERPVDAAVRELREELSLGVDPGELTLEVDETHSWEGRPDHCKVFALTLDAPPNVEVDNREVVSAEFVTAEEALKRNLFPLLRQHVEARLKGRSAPAVVGS